MQCVAVITQRNSSTSGHFVDVNVLVQVNYILALRMHLDKNLVLAHHLLSRT